MENPNSGHISIFILAMARFWSRGGQNLVSIVNLIVAYSHVVVVSLSGYYINYIHIIFIIVSLGYQTISLGLAYHQSQIQNQYYELGLGPIQRHQM